MRARDSLINRINSLMTRFNSLLGRNKFSVPMRRELHRKPLNCLLDYEPKPQSQAQTNKIPCIFPASREFGFRDEFARDSLLQRGVRPTRSRPKISRAKVNRGSLPRPQSAGLDLNAPSRKLSSIGGKGLLTPAGSDQASGLGPIESLLAEKLWVADFCRTCFEVLGGLVIILRETADHAF